MHRFKFVSPRQWIAQWNWWHPPVHLWNSVKKPNTPTVQFFCLTPAKFIPSSWRDRIDKLDRMFLILFYNMKGSVLGDGCVVLLVLILRLFAEHCTSTPTNLPECCFTTSEETNCYCVEHKMQSWGYRTYSKGLHYTLCVYGPSGSWQLYFIHQYCCRFSHGTLAQFALNCPFCQLKLPPLIKHCKSLVKFLTQVYIHSHSYVLMAEYSFKQRICSSWLNNS